MAKEKEFDELVKEYDELREKELELIKARHSADRELQITRFKIANIAADIARTHVTGDMPCW